MAFQFPFKNGICQQGYHPPQIYLNILYISDSSFFHMHTCAVLSRFSNVQLFATLLTVAHQTPLSTGFSRSKNTEVGYHALLQRIFLSQGSNPRLICLLHWQAGSLPLAPPGKQSYKLFTWFVFVSVS